MTSISNNNRDTPKKRLKADSMYAICKIAVAACCQLFNYISVGSCCVKGIFAGIIPDALRIAEGICSILCKQFCSAARNGGCRIYNLHLRACYLSYLLCKKRVVSASQYNMVCPLLQHRQEIPLQQLPPLCRRGLSGLHKLHKPLSCLF